MEPKEVLGPMGDRIVVRPDPVETVSAGGLYLATNPNEKPQKGTVVASGPGVWEHGVYVPNQLTVGDRVLYGKFAGSQVEVNNETLLILRHGDVLARIL